jgi:Flp pilus assembly CpaE family ATPase
LVINQYGQLGELPIPEAEDALGEKLTSFVPYDPKAINVANNTGIPVVVKDSHSKLALSIMQLVKNDHVKRSTFSAYLPKLRSGGS